jgi:hypothetical protein
MWEVMSFHLYSPLSDESFNFQERSRAYSLTDVSATA